MDRMMMMSRRDALALVVALGVPASALATGDASTAGGGTRVALENDAVRVVDYASVPQSGACGAGRHWHPAHLTIFMAPARLKVTRADGTTFVSNRNVGEVLWFPAGEHAVENVGDGPARLINVEVKDKNWRPS